MSSVHEATATAVRTEREPRERLLPLGASLWRLSWRPTVAYAASRAAVLLTMGIVAAVNGGSLAGRIERWDSVWYLEAARSGYPAQLPVVGGHVVANTLAFFPGLPLAIRALTASTGMSQLAAGVAISTLTGLTATIGVYALVREYAGPRAANAAAILFAFFPGSFVFSLIYSEGICITCASFGLLALMKKRWVAAGLLGFVATATAPISLPFILSAGWAAWTAIRKDRDWRALAAPVLTPLGALAYLIWTWQHTGVLSAFRLTERGGWQSYLSIVYPFHVVWSFLSHPFGDTTAAVLFFCMIGVVVGLVIAVIDRQPPLVLIYGVSVAALAFLTAPVGPRPRIILDAFPVILAVAVRFQRGWPLWVITTCSAAALLVLTAFEIGFFPLFP